MKECRKSVAKIKTKFRLILYANLQTLYIKEKVAITCTATLNKHEDIKREYKKNFVLVHRFKI